MLGGRVTETVNAPDDPVIVPSPSTYDAGAVAEDRSCVTPSPLV